jgi:hypothetical protein
MQFGNLSYIAYVELPQRSSKRQSEEGRFGSRWEMCLYGGCVSSTENPELISLSYLFPSFSCAVKKKDSKVQRRNDLEKENYTIENSKTWFVEN